jgi:hypothetical protein
MNSLNKLVCSAILMATVTAGSLHARTTLEIPKKNLAIWESLSTPQASPPLALEALAA